MGATPPGNPAGSLVVGKAAPACDLRAVDAPGQSSLIQPLTASQEASGGDDTLRVRIWGARGSVPVSGSEFRRYGGNTACVEVSCGGRTLLFDAGTGIKPAGVQLLKEGVRDVHLFFTHFHYDHVQGFPFFAPLYDGEIGVKIWSGLTEVMTTQQMLRELMRPPWFPVGIGICSASLDARDLKAGDVLHPWPEVTLRTARLNHPGGCIGYRVEFGGRAVAIVFDTEHVEGAPDANVLSLIDKADLVLYDATYTDEEMRKHRGFGHSSWQEGVRLCKAAGAGKLGLFHHDPFRSDADLARIEANAKAAFPGAFAARDGQSIEIVAAGAKQKSR
jgi:phosphoribosyl 1,2-cyclic phosphodiesterase